MNWDIISKYWSYVPAALEKPGKWFAAAVDYAPKTALVIALVIALKAFL